MIPNKWFIAHLILFTYYVIIFAQHKRIVFGKNIIGFDGRQLIPVFFPISWLIHDIHSAKLIGSKPGPNEMMTSDMTPDENGNFKRQSLSDNEHNRMKIRDIVKEISNRNLKIAERSRINTTMNEEKSFDEKYTLGKPNQNNFEKQNFFVLHHDKDLLKQAEMTITLESIHHKLMARKKFTDMILSKQDKWPTGTDKPIFTSVEIYDIPGANKYIGLASNRSVVHKEPEIKPTKSYINIQGAKV